MNSVIQSPTYYEELITAVQNNCDFTAQQLDCMKCMCTAKDDCHCPPDGEIISRRSVILKNSSKQYCPKGFAETNSGCSKCGTNVTKANNNSCLHSKSQVTVRESKKLSTGERVTLNMKCAQSKFKKAILKPTSSRSTANDKLCVCRKINSKDRSASKTVQKNKERNNSSKQVSKKRDKQEKYLTKLHYPFKGSSASLKDSVNKGKSDNTKKVLITKRSRNNIDSNKRKGFVKQEKSSTKNQNKVVKRSDRKAGKYDALTENAVKKIIPHENMVKGKIRRNSGKVQTSGMQDWKRKTSNENKTTCLPRFKTKKPNVSYQNMNGKNSQMNTVNTLMQKSFVNTRCPIFNRNIPNNAIFHRNVNPRKFTERVGNSNCANKGVNNLKNYVQKPIGLKRMHRKSSQIHQHIMTSSTSASLNNSAEGYAPYYNQPTFARRTYPRHLHQSVYPNIPFVVAKSTTPSHNLKINVQTALSLINTKPNFGQQAINNHYRYYYENGKGDCGGVLRRVVSYKTMLSQVLSGKEQPSFSTNISYTDKQSPALENMDHCLTSSPECVDQHQEFDLTSTQDGVTILSTEHDSSNIKYVLKHIYDEFKNLIKKQHQLKQTISFDSEDGMEELEELESKIQAKEDEVNVILGLYREASSLRQQLQAVSASSTTPVYLHNIQSHPTTAVTTKTIQLTKVLRAVKRFQEHLKNSDTNT